MDFTNTLDFDNSTSFTIYVVYKKETIANAFNWFAGSSNYPRLDFRTGQIDIRNNTGSPRSVSYTDDTNIKILAITVDRSLDEYKMYINNSYIGASTSSVTNWELNIHKIYRNSGTNIYSGNILFYSDAHTASQVTEVSEWLNEKYDIYDPYVPPITDDLELYFNPDVKVYSDAGTTLAVDGENIRQINDRSGNDNTLNQTTGSYQPVYSTSTLGNGNSSIHVDASNFFNLSSTVEIGSSDSFTMYVVYKKGTNTRNSVISGPGSSNSDRIDLRVSYVQAFIGGTNSFISHSDNSDLKIITVVVDRSDNTYKVYKVGTSIGSNSRTFGAVDYTKMFGGIITGGNIDYGNVLLYKDAHSSTEVGTMSDWLNEKYDIY